MMPTFGVDLITFYHPHFWGLSTVAELETLGRENPVLIWQRIFDALAEAGVSALEMTFAPADADSVIRAFGSARAFRLELEGRGLFLASGFWGPPDWSASTEEIGELARVHAEFLAAAGARTMVIGPPMRTSTDATPPRFIDLATMIALATRLHAIGAATRTVGVMTAIHTEAHSVFCQPRDIDLLLALTDPNYVSFCPDAAHITLSGGDAVEVARRYRDRITIAHWKDAVGPMDRHVPIGDDIHTRHREFMRSLGDGIVDWAGWNDVMATTDGADLVLLELDATPDPITEMVAARERLIPTVSNRP